MEALTHRDPVAIAQVGLGAWGANLVRNVDVLADLVWICDAATSAERAVRAPLPERARDRRRTTR